MSAFDSNPFGGSDPSNPFADPSVRQVTSGQNRPVGLDDYNPFAEKPTSAATRPAAAVPAASDTRPAAAAATIAATQVQQPPVAPPAYTPTPAQQVDTAELQRRQEELERKAAELQEREERLRQNNFNPRADNWPPLPKFCPKPCFYQDFEVDIPSEFRRTVRIMYYIWMTYSIILAVNIIFCLVAFIMMSQDGQGKDAGVSFGLSLLWLFLFVPASFLCWYRPVYKAFRNDSSINFFAFFFVFFAQCIASVIFALGISGSGFAGWVTAFSMIGLSNNVKVAGGILVIMSALFTAHAALCCIMLLRIIRLYRRTGASFAQAQRELAQGVFSNPGMQAAAGQAVVAAAGSYAGGQQSSGNKY